MLALCLMLRHTYYAQNYAGIIRTGLVFKHSLHHSIIACLVNGIHSHVIAFVQTHEAFQDLLSAYKGRTGAVVTSSPPKIMSWSFND